jgi:hypothetical protein
MPAKRHLPAADAASILRKRLDTAGIRLPQYVQMQNDPLEIFRFSAELGSKLNGTILKALTELEVKAVATARPVLGQPK